MPLSRLALAVALSTRALIAFAEENKDAQPVKLDDVIVTATKEGYVSLQKVPLAISAFTGEDLEASGIKNLEDLQYQTPGLNLTRNGQATRLYLRGIGTNLDFIGSDPSVTLHTDGVYQSRTSTVLNDLFDVDRVEVLRGPQGTLYGRNSIGGTINVVSSLPTEETEARVAADVGNYQQTRIEAMASGALAAPQLLGRIAVLKADHDPYVDNLNPNGIDGLMDDDTFSSKGTLRYLMGDKGEFLLRGDYTQVDRATGAYKPTGLDRAGRPSPLAGAINVPTDPWETNISYASPFVDLQDRGTSGELQYHLSPATTLVSITGYRDLNFHTIEDTDGSNLDVLVTELEDKQDQVSEELRLQTVSGAWSTVMGLYYLEEDHRAVTDLNFNAVGRVSHFDSSNETSAYAAFSQVTYAFTPHLNGTVGLRYSYEKKHFTNANAVTDSNGATLASFQTDKTTDWDNVSPKAGVDYTFDQGPMVYASASQGFKSGGFNFTSNNPEFNQETVWSYEVGAKMEWQPQRLRSNVALFYYDYTDLQVQDFITPGVLNVSNAADATVQGFEIENQWLPTADWLIELNYAYLDATYDSYRAPSDTDTSAKVDVSGNYLNAAPKHKINAAVEYFQNLSAGTLSYRVEYAWQDKQYFTATNSEVSSQDAYGLWNARLGFLTLDERWEFQAYGENLSDENYSTSSREFTAVHVGVTKDVGPPLTFGGKVVYHFM